METTILIVEKSPEILELLRRFIEKAGYNTIIATDGEKGLKYARRYLPHLVVAERLLPRMNGLQLCRKIKDSSETEHIPVIFLSILDSEKDIIEGLKAGADDYVKKPFSPDELVARIEVVLHRCRKINTKKEKH
ncbi:MAG: response regulator [Spirochaetota bacterium]